ncbi:MAG TPA: hypothetical protein VN428_08170 [Bryobacteraceae bacterium]|nr:hypothetical protein [Bryobacteraceae bacterium]
MSSLERDPHNEYVRRLEKRVEVAARFDRTHIRVGNVNVMLAIAAALIAWAAFGYGALSPLWLLAAGAVFLVLSIYHGRVLRKRKRAARAARFYENGIARVEGRWAGRGYGGEHYDDPAHPYAEDLDLFGRGSLYELLCAARLRTGEKTLAEWLLNSAGLDEIRARHQAIDELRSRLDLREDISLLGEEVRSGINPGDLVRWSEQDVILESRSARIVAVILAAAAVAGAVVWWITGFVTPLIVVGIIEAIFYFRFRSRISKVVEAVGKPAYGLGLLSEVLARFEREKFASPRLAELRKQLDIHGHAPSRQIARLNRLMEMLDSRDNVLVRVIGPPLLWTTQLAFAVEAWRKENGRAVRHWISAVGEMEAFLSLASYAYEHPADPFPEITAEGPIFDADAIAHPLLDERKAVRNDVHLGADLRVLVVSGSNMSGKSTLLRTVGVNAVLAMAGAPVRAKRLVISSVAVGASIRTLDSLQSGTSRFYAEIKRLRLLIEQTNGPRPLLFLLDELLHGTNSHDRKAGGEAVVRSLVQRGAFGLLTTHDLALAHIADELYPRAINVHFQDFLEDGNMKFDYRLRPGVVTKSNALELMRSVGLDV